MAGTLCDAGYLVWKRAGTFNKVASYLVEHLTYDM